MLAKSCLIIYSGLFQSANFLSSFVIKMLIDSLVLSRLDYALPVWGPPLSEAFINCLHAKTLELGSSQVRITKLLRKYDHISHHLGSLS